jgi:putative flippase GtrA
VGSIVAFGLSNLFFALFYWAGEDTTICSIAGFLGGAVPNWILNRRWAWQQSGRPPAKQVITYALVSAVVVVSTALATHQTNAWVIHHVENHHGLRLLIVTGSYVLMQVLLFVAKFAIYEFWVFSDRSRVRVALRSLMNVTRIARANRIP